MQFLVKLFFMRNQESTNSFPVCHTLTLPYIWSMKLKKTSLPGLSCWRWSAPGEGAPIAGCAGTDKRRQKLSITHLQERSQGCGRQGMNSVVTFSMLLWCFCSLSRSVGRATLMNLWMGASRRLSVSLLPSSAMCPADCPQLTPRRNLDTAPAPFPFFSLSHSPHRHCKYP